MEDFIADTQLWFDSLHMPELDEFMLIISGLAEWFPWMLAGIILCFGIHTCINTLRAERMEEIPLADRTTWLEGLEYTALPLLALIVETLLVQPIKHLVNEPRPVTWFAGHFSDRDHVLHLVQDYDIDYYLSFPSGHTAAAFALATALIYMLPSNFSRSSRSIIAVVLYLIATMVGISRVYLHQHFLHDVCAGAFIGVFAAWIIYRIWGVLLSGHCKK